MGRSIVTADHKNWNELLVTMGLMGTLIVGGNLAFKFRNRRHEEQRLRLQHEGDKIREIQF